MTAASERLAVERAQALSFAADCRRLTTLLRTAPPGPYSKLGDRVRRMPARDRAEAERLLRRLARAPGVIGAQWRAELVILAAGSN